MLLRLDRVFAAGLLVALAAPALAQQPTEAQINAIRSNCRSDFLSNCSGVPRGGPEAVRCLKDHMDKLSSGCRTAVSAITPAPAPAPKVAAPTPAPATPAAPPVATAPATAPTAPPPETAPAAPVAPPATPAPAAQPSTANAPAAAPAPSTTKKTQPAQPKSAQPAAPQPNRAAAAPTAPATPAPAAQPASLLPLPPLAPRVRLMIVRTCAAEHRALCANVPAGGGGIVECLAEHGDALSPRCRDAILSAK
jgi:outer membrane biosynthesis protein TonB